MENINIKHLFFFLLSNCLGTSILFAQPFLPYIDSTFGNAGQIYLQDNFKFIPGHQFVQADGKILVAGYGKATPTSGGGTQDDLDGIIYRLNENGTKDLSFGANGFKTIDIDGTQDAIEGVVETADHKILILLNSFKRTIFVRLLPDGSYDPDFGNDGILLTEAVNTESSNAMVIQADQKIVICGFEKVFTNLNKGYFRRFNPDGSSDTGFGTNGYVSCEIDAAKNLELNALALQQDGKILATGLYGTGSSSGFPVVRLNTDGSFDNTFSGDGKYLKVMGNSTYPAQAFCIAVNLNGKIFVGGNAPAPTTSEPAMTVVAVKPDGITDTNFGSFGATKILVSFYNSVNSLFIQPDGKIVLGGYCYLSTTTTAFLMTRVNPNGVQDLTFGPSDGYFATILDDLDSYNVDIIEKITLLSNGKMLVLGWSNTSVNLTANEKAIATVSRYSTDVLVETFEPNLVFHAVLVYPSPIKDELVTLQYELDNAREVSLLLFDANGREISTLVDHELRSAGQQQEHFYLPATLSAGNYFLQLTTDDGQKAIQFSKF